MDTLVERVVKFCDDYFVLPKELNNSINFIDVLHLLLEFYYIRDLAGVVDLLDAWLTICDA